MKMSLKERVRQHSPIAALVVLLSFCSGARAVMINGFEFDLGQFAGAAVTYRADGSVAFDGKLWDNANGVDGVTLAELASGQFGGDPGDQVTLQNTPDPDWLLLTYATPIVISPTAHVLVIHEITSSAAGVDTEGTSFQVSFNAGALIMASHPMVVASHYDTPPAGTAASENTIQLVFDLYDFGFSDGDMFSTLYIENTDSGSGTSDPDFIFAGIAGTLATVSAPGSTVLLLGGSTLLLASGLGRRPRRWRAPA